MELRPYQKDLLDRARQEFSTGARSILIQAPTGSGKTAVAAVMLKLAKDRGKRCLFIAHRRELLHQASEEFSKFDIPHAVIMPGQSSQDAPISIISVQTLGRRLRNMPIPDFVVWDEASHLAANSWSRIKLAFDKSHHVGITPVPERLDGKGLAGHFDCLIQGPSVRSLIDQGYLCDYRIFAPPSVNLAGIRKIGGDYEKAELAYRMQSLMGDITFEYEKHARGLQCLVFGVMIRHSQAIEEAFNKAGHICHHVDGDTNKTTRDELVYRYSKKQFPVLTNCDLFGEGFNVPGIECLILARPTASMALYRQQVGRALRPSPSKGRAIIIDMAGNVHRHGAPCDDIQWSLEGKKSRQITKNPYRTCSSCYFMQPIHLDRCEECGFVFPTEVRDLPEEKAGELVEFNPEELKRKRRLERIQATSFSELVALGKRRRYKNPAGWAWFVLSGRKRREWKRKR